MTAFDIVSACHLEDTGGMATDARPDADTTRQTARRWQFSLQTALVAMLAVGASLGLWVRRATIRQNRRAMIERHEKANYSLAFEAPCRDHAGHSLHVLVFADGRQWNAPWMNIIEEFQIYVVNGQFEEVCHLSEVLETTGDNDYRIGLEERNGTAVLTIGGPLGDKFSIAADGIRNLAGQWLIDAVNQLVPPIGPDRTVDTPQAVDEPIPDGSP